MSDFEYVFVADLFVEDYSGGAELTLEALIQGAPGKVAKVHGKNLTKEFMQEHKDKTWIFGNYASVSRALLIDAALDLNYFIVECDYKYCKYRSSHGHELAEKVPCDCHLKEQGKFTLGFFARSKGVFFMSEGQLNEYKRLFPKLENPFLSSKLHVQFSTWSDEHLVLLDELYVDRRYIGNNDKWAVLGGASWIKNQEETEKLLKEKGMDYDVIGGLPYEEFLKKLSEYKGLYFHPAGFDTCPRIVIEAKLMGLSLDLGDNVQIKEELETKFSSIQLLSEYLDTRIDSFWKEILASK